MANLFPPHWSPYGGSNLPLNAELTPKASEAVEIGDLLYWDAGNSVPRQFSRYADQSSAAAQQLALAPLFLGAANSARSAADATTGTPLRILTDLVVDMPCESGTFALGDLVGPSYDTDHAHNQRVVNVGSDITKAIGRAVKRYGSATTKVKCRLTSRYLAGLSWQPIGPAALDLRAVCATQLDKASNTTLANIPGLSVNVLAGRKYAVRAVLFVTATANGGIKVALSGTATITSGIVNVLGHTATTVSVGGQATALDSGVGATAATAAVFIDAELLINAAGTLTVQAAQNASHADTTSVKAGSFLEARLLA